MTLRWYCALFIMITCLVGSGGGVYAQAAPSTADGLGERAIRDGNWSLALQQILMDSIPEDSLLRNFKLAVIYRRLKNYSTALELLRKVTERNNSLTPAAYLYIAEIENEIGRTGNSLAAYRTVLRENIPPRLRSYIFMSLKDILAQDTAFGMEQAPWLEEYYRWLPAQEAKDTTSALDSIALYLKSGKYHAADSLLDSISLSGSRGCSFLSDTDILLHCEKLSIPTIYKCARIAHRCGQYEIAQRLYKKLMKTPGFFKVLPEKQFIRVYSELMFDKQDWHETIRWHKKYSEKFGDNADVFFSIARAYRKIGKQREADRWYDRLMNAYPHHSKTEEIVWLRAWQYEDRGKYSQAGEYYRKIYSGNGKRVDESYVRHGLCYYRQKKYDSAMIVLQQFQDRLPFSYLDLAGRFWYAKCCLAQGKKEDAMMIFRLVSYKEPYDYYAHRSRRILMEFGDTTPVIIDTVPSRQGMISWFDSISALSNTRKMLSGSDSSALLCGIFLVKAGDVEKADFFIERIELAFPGNLDLQYQLIMLYTTAGASGKAYRIARRLTWRIPQQCRQSLPRAVYEIFYPTFYADFIATEVQRYNGLASELVSGIIRQESIFDPKIVSPAGAIGLMQIMPATGSYIAKKLAVKFDADSLSNPYYNLRSGIFYVDELLQRFDGNLVLALAGYNAGPHNANKWKSENAGKEHDLFVEDIGFTETRGYVKKVIANYWTYSLLRKYR